MLNLKHQAAASNGKTAVLVGELGGEPVIVRYAGDWKNKDAFNDLIDRAINKLGWKRDRRARCGYRRLST